MPDLEKLGFGPAEPDTFPDEIPEIIRLLTVSRARVSALHKEEAKQRRYARDARRKKPELPADSLFISDSASWLLREAPNPAEALRDYVAFISTHMRAPESFHYDLSSPHLYLDRNLDDNGRPLIRDELLGIQQRFEIGEAVRYDSDAWLSLGAFFLEERAKNTLRAWGRELKNYSPGINLDAIPAVQEAMFFYLDAQLPERHKKDIADSYALALGSV